MVGDPLIGGTQIEFQFGPGGVATAACTLGGGELSNGQQIAVLSPFPWIWFELGYEYNMDVLVCTSVYFC